MKIERDRLARADKVILALVDPEHPDQPASAACVQRAAQQLESFLADSNTRKAMVISGGLKLFQRVGGVWEHVGPADEGDEDDGLGVEETAAERHQRRLELLRMLHHACPKCEHAGRCGVSEHAFFVTNQIGLRCERCLHVWGVGHEDLLPLPVCTGCGRATETISESFYFDKGGVVARCDGCHMLGVVGSDEPWIAFLAPDEGVVRPDREREGRLAAMIARVRERELWSLVVFRAEANPGCLPVTGAMSYWWGEEAIAEPQIPCKVVNAIPPAEIIEKMCDGKSPFVELSDQPRPVKFREFL